MRPAIDGWRWHLILVSVLGAVWAACSPPGDPPGRDGGDACVIGCDAAVDASFDAGDAARDAGMDAATNEWGFDWDAWVAPLQPCDATFIQLPPTGLRDTTNVSHLGMLVGYDDRRYPPDDDLRADIYIYDLASCTELVVTRRVGVQNTPYLWQSTLLFRDAPVSGSSDSFLVSFDMQNGSFTRLPALYNGAFPRYNGRYILYDSYVDSPQSGLALTLWDTWNGDEVRLAEDVQGAEDPSLSLTHAAWVAWGGPGKDVFYADLESMVVVQVASTIDPEVWYATTWGDWLLWEDRRNGDADIYGIRLSTGEEFRLTDNGAWNGMPKLKNGIACYRTTQWNTTGFDLAIYEVETGVTRRVPITPDPGYKCGMVDSGWLVYQKQVGTYNQNQIFAIDLIAAGILDDQGEQVLPE
jgi:hypothetical protein